MAMTDTANAEVTTESDCHLPWPQQVLWSLIALATFHAAHDTGLGWLLIPCAYALIELSYAASNRKVVYPLLALGFLFYAPQLAFFWNIFNAAAIALWLVLAFWLALFGLTLRLVRRRFGRGWMRCWHPSSGPASNIFAVNCTTCGSVG
jgi:hypothetical protein